MKCFSTFFLIFVYFNSFGQLPDGFVYVKTIVPDIDVELRYCGTNNFVGKPIDGYLENKLILTHSTALALKRVQAALQKNNLCLKVYDGYRPQRAVNHFVLWSKDLNDTINKKNYYPQVDKKQLFSKGYIAARSGHSKGSTVDVTLIDGNTGNPLDMGSSYDFFGKKSWTHYKDISEEQKKNRNRLLQVMTTHGFVNFSQEWWHFTLREEPFPNTYFDFPVK